MLDFVSKRKSNKEFNKEYYSVVSKIAMPVILQNLFSSTLGFVDLFMVARLGNYSIAAIGFSNQIFSILFNVMNGIACGAGIFIAQFSGKKEYDNVRSALKLALFMSGILAFIVSAIAILFPDIVLGLFSQDASVLKEGIPFLKIVAFSYVPSAITVCFVSGLMNLKNAKVPLMAGVVAMTLNTVLNYLLIYGSFGFPKMGIKGAAIATLSSKTIECMIILGYIYLTKHILAENYFKIKISLKFAKKYIKATTSIIINTFSWSFGQAVYVGLYAMVGIQYVAAINVADSIQKFLFIVFTGVSSATGVLVGNCIGEKDDDKTFKIGLKSIKVVLITAVILGGSLFFLSPYIAGNYGNLDYNMRIITGNILRIISLVLWLKVLNMVLIQGIIRAGGDVRYSMWQNIIAMWLFGVPITIFAVKQLHLSIYIVILCTLSEEIVKFIGSIHRFRTKRWIIHLTE